MRLVLIRHGETDHNKDQLTLGRADVPLNERGRAQAAAVAASFRAAPAAIYASPLRRAVEIAEAISVVVAVPVMLVALLAIVSAVTVNGPLETGVNVVSAAMRSLLDCRTR